MSGKLLHEIQDMKVAVDILVLGYKQEKLNVLLIQREYPPFAGQWALPGGFVLHNEEIETAAIRVVKTETGFPTVEFLREIGTFGKVNRDPRRRVISIAYMVLVNELYQVSGQVTEYMATSDAQWFELARMPKDLAFDHEDILAKGLTTLQNSVVDSNILRWLMPTKFTMSDLQTCYEQVLGEEQDKRNFQRTIEASGILRELAEKQHGNHRPARLYQFAY